MAINIPEIKLKEINENKPVIKYDSELYMSNRSTKFFSSMPVSSQLCGNSNILSKCNSLPLIQPLSSNINKQSEQCDSTNSIASSQVNIKDSICTIKPVNQYKKSQHNTKRLASRNITNSKATLVIISSTRSDQAHPSQRYENYVSESIDTTEPKIIPSLSVSQNKLLCFSDNINKNPSCILPIHINNIKGKEKSIDITGNIKSDRCITELKIKMNIGRLLQLYEKNNSLYNIMTFFNGEEINSIMNISRQLRILIKYSIEDAYLNNIREQLKKRNQYFDLLSATITFSRVRKKTMKIDCILHIRFKNIFHYSSFYTNKVTNLGISFIHRHYNQRKNKFIDYCSVDLVPINSYESFPCIYMSREFTTFNYDILQKTYIQTILPFKENDQAFLNIKVFSPEHGFINNKSLSFKYKLNTIPTVKNNSEINPRVCEYEDVCFHWKDFSYLEQKAILLSQLKEIFEPHFSILQVYFENIGYLVFKVTLKAEKVGAIKNKEELGISIIIKEKDGIVLNEVKKNDLLFERRNKFEMRIGDQILFYLTNNRIIK